MTPEGSRGNQTKRKPRRPCRHSCEHIAQVMNPEIKAAETDQHDQQAGGKHRQHPPSAGLHLPAIFPSAAVSGSPETTSSATFPKIQLAPMRMMAPVVWSSPRNPAGDRFA
jgi:hypothetical protein